MSKLMREDEGQGLIDWSLVIAAIAIATLGATLVLPLAR
jgi:hypothetical protein